MSCYILILVGQLIAYWILANDRFKPDIKPRLARLPISFYRFFLFFVTTIIEVAICTPYPMVYAAIMINSPKIPLRTAVYNKSENKYCNINYKTELLNLLNKQTSKSDAKNSKMSQGVDDCTTMYVNAKNSGAVADFHISVIQFGENGLRRDENFDEKEIKNAGKLKNNFQIDQLKKILTENRKNLVVVYIHGWRHDDRAGDSNFANLAHLAHYSAAFIKGRDKDQGNGYEKRKLVVVYFAWRGNQLQNDDGKWLSTLKASITFPLRKRVAERTSGKVFETLKSIKDKLTELDNNNKLSELEKNRMLVVVHSLGGNLLLSGIQPMLKEKIEARITKAFSSLILAANKKNENKNNNGKKNTNGKEGTKLKDLICDKKTAGEMTDPMKLPIADMIALINPATEASRWIEHQRIMYRKFHEGLRKLKFTDEESRKYHSRIFDCVFQNNQNPLVISFTSGSTDISLRERNKKLRDKDKWINQVSFNHLIPTLVLDKFLVEDDWVTKYVFPASQILFEGHWFSPEKAYAMGHYRSPYSTYGNLIPPGSKLGISHLAESNGSRGKRTTFMNAQNLIATQKKITVKRNKTKRRWRDKKRIACIVDPSWLWYVRAKKGRILDNDKLKNTLKKLAKVPGHRMISGWDADYPGGKVDTRMFSVIDEGVGLGRTYNVQYIHKIYRSGTKSPMPAAFPFWNVRTLDTLIAAHNG